MVSAVIDDTDRVILDSLIADCRISLRALASRAGLSAPAVRERIRRMEEMGVIEGFTIGVDARALGFPLEAIVRLEPLPGKLRQVERALQAMPQILECSEVTGEDCFFARMVLRDIDDLGRLLDPLHTMARTNTSIVKRTPVARRRPPI